MLLCFDQMKHLWCETILSIFAFREKVKTVLPLGPVKMTSTFSRCREKPGPREIKGKTTSQNVKTVLPEECTGGGAGVRPGRAPRGGANRPSHNRKHPFQNFRSAGVHQNHFSLWTTGPGCRRRRLPLRVRRRHAVEAADGSVRVVSRHSLIQNSFSQGR